MSTSPPPADAASTPTPAGAPAVAADGDLSTGPWEQRLAHVVDMMREMSSHSDPQRMVSAYRRQIRRLLPGDGYLSLSRRGLEYPLYRVTRSSEWERAGRDVNPWETPEQLPLLEGGLLAEVIYADRPFFDNDLSLSADDPARPFLRGARSLAAVPMFDQGTALNMVVQYWRKRDGVNPEKLPENVWIANLFGRATHNLVLRHDLQRAYDQVEREMQVVADIQRSLLPTELPRIPTLELAAHYQTSRQAGGDYYDFFPLPDGRWGILVADVSGHGTPAAVLMAVTHSIAHTFDGEPDPPSKLLSFINRHLAARYTAGSGSFVTAFYGIYDPATRGLTYASAGHSPARVKREGRPTLGEVPRLPLGIEPGERYIDQTEHLAPGDALVLYTDGITEARNPAGDMFGQERLDEVVRRCDCGARQIVDAVLKAVAQFTLGRAADDDRTLLVARVV